MIAAWLLGGVVAIHLLNVVAGRRRQARIERARVRWIPLDSSR